MIHNCLQNHIQNTMCSTHTAYNNLIRYEMKSYGTRSFSPILFRLPGMQMISKAY